MFKEEGRGEGSRREDVISGCMIMLEVWGNGLVIQDRDGTWRESLEWLAEIHLPGKAEIKMNGVELGIMCSVALAEKTWSSTITM